MNAELKLENVELDVDGAEGGRIWIYGEDDEMSYIKVDEIEKVIEYLSQFVKED